MGFLYDLVGTGAMLLASPYLLWRSLRQPAEMRERWGGGPDWGLRRPVWWHAASVGELEALRPVMAEVEARRLSVDHAVTVLTPTGRARAQSIWRGAMAVRMAPMDWRPVVGRCYRRLEPRALILVETEIWPALLGEAHRRALPVGVINGRISKHSFKRYKMLRGLLHPLLEKVRCVAARTQGDAQAFARLGVPREALQVTGNTKYNLPERPEKEPQWLRRKDWTNVLVMGSLRSEELEAVRRAVEVFNDSQGESDRALIVLAPRHLDRAPSFVDIARRLNLPHARRSDIGTTLTPPGSGVFVLILDTLGELQDLWWMATAGFVGGTLAPLGGHNLYEPASRGCPTIFGPSVDTVADVADALLQSAAGRMVPDGERLGQALVEYVSLGGVREQASRRAMETAARLSGGAVRSVDWLMSRGVLASP